MSRWFESTRVIALAGTALGIALAWMTYFEGRKNDSGREEAINVLRSDHGEILDAVRFQPSGTWVQLEDGTARAEWLRDEGLSEWASRALFAASLARDINGKGGPR